MRSVSLLLLLALAGCGTDWRNDLPQAQHTFTSASPRQAEFVEARRVGIQISSLVQKNSAPYAGIGFLQREPTVGYAIARNGGAWLFPAGAASEKLEAVPAGIDRVITAGAGGNYLLGVSPSGTVTALNARTKSRPRIIRRQESTFNQSHLFDAQPLKDSDLVAAAVENNRIELWNVASGSLSAAKVAGGQPRVIGRGSKRQAVFYGTDTGEVRLWKGGSRSEPLYVHRGPVMDIEVAASGQKIFSGAKDGTVIVWDKASNQVTQLTQFPKAVRKVLVDDDASHLVAVPAIGKPQLFDLKTNKRIELSWGAKAPATDPMFLPDGQGLLVRFGVEGVGYWPLKDGSRPRLFRPRYASGKGLISFVAAPSKDILILLSGAGRVEYWKLSNGQYLGTALASAEGVARIAVDPTGTRLLVALANNDVIGMPMAPLKSQTIMLGADED